MTVTAVWLEVLTEDEVDKVIIRKWQNNCLITGFLHWCNYSIAGSKKLLIMHASENVYMKIEYISSVYISSVQS